MAESKGKITGQQLAKICGVSQGTVDRALNNRNGISAKTKEKILAAAKEYGYIKNLRASSLSSGKSHIIGVIAFDLNNSFFAQTVDTVSKKATEKGYSVITAMSYKNFETEKKAISQMVAMGVDGIILCPVGHGKDYVNLLINTEIPVITYGNKLEGIPFVGIDNKKAMAEEINCLLKRGFEKFIYIYTASNQIEYNNIYAQEKRYLGFCSATRNMKNNIVVKDECYAVKTVEYLLKDNAKTAVICPGDIQAIKVLSEIRRRNILLGNFEVFGFDNIKILELLNYNFHTVDIGIEKTAEICLNEILSQTPKSNIIEYKII